MKYSDLTSRPIASERLVTSQLPNEPDYRQLIELVPELIFRVSPLGTFTFVNPAVQQLLGYTEAECLSMRALALVLPSQRSVLISKYRDLVGSGQESGYAEFPVTTKAGGTVWIGQTVRLVVEANRVTGLVGVARDISERKQAESLLQTEQARLAALITSRQAGILVVNERGEVLLANQFYCDMFEPSATPAQLTGTASDSLLTKAMKAAANPEPFYARIQTLLKNQQPAIGEVARLRNGRVVKGDYIPIYLDGRYMGHLWQFNEVTEQYMAREHIRRNEAKYRRILNNVELGLLETNNEQVVVQAYEGFCQMLGYQVYELIGRRVDELLVAPSFREELRRQQQLRERGLSSSYEMQLIRKDGSHIWMLISGIPLHDEHGELVGSMSIHYDITNPKQLEIELASAKQLAEASRQDEKQFLANMSHEIRTPLNAIIGMSHLLFDTQPTPQQREYIDTLKTSADFLHGLISNLLDMTKIEAGRVEINAKPFDLAAMLRATQKVFEIKLQERPIQFHILLDARISGNFIGDDVMLNQILTNLVGNAEKFTDVGSIQLTVRIHHEDATYSWVEFAVTDTGIGIPAEKHELVFQKFKQINPHGHKHKGTGLGLAITKELIELMGGSIRVESRVGYGSVFTFLIPFPKLNAPLAQPPDQMVPPSTSPQVGNVLVVEDNAMNQKYIISLLKKWQVRYTLASDGRQAVMEARRQRFDLILMDIQMPVMNGYEAAVVIRQSQNPNQHVPIVALTASVMVEHKNVALEAGMTDFLTKPFDPGQLLQVLRQYPPQPPVDSRFELDRERLLEVYGEDMTAASELFSDFLTDVVPELLQFPVLCRQQKWAELSQQVHKLKPTLGMVGLTRIEATMNRLEKVTQKPIDYDLINVYCQEVVVALQAAIPVLEEEIQLLNAR